MPNVSHKHQKGHILSTRNHIHNLDLQPHSSPGKSGYQYDVHYEGKLLCTSHDPVHAACRALVKQELKGEARFFREGTHTLTMTNIEKGALYSVSETSKGGLRLVKYREFRSVSTRTREFRIHACLHD